jgi:hypothetical protein
MYVCCFTDYNHYPLDLMYFELQTSEINVKHHNLKRLVYAIKFNEYFFLRYEKNFYLKYEKIYIKYYIMKSDKVEHQRLNIVFLFLHFPFKFILYIFHKCMECLYRVIYNNTIYLISIFLLMKRIIMR